MTDLGDLLAAGVDPAVTAPCPCGFHSTRACAMTRSVPGACQHPTTLPTLAELPPSPPCESCGCCRADLCAAALDDGAACLMLAPPRPTPAAAELSRCPCAPLVCRCSLPAHVRGIARCQHGVRARQAAAQASGR